jgi:hypothetical protein
MSRLFLLYRAGALYFAGNLSWRVLGVIAHIIVGLVAEILLQIYRRTPPRAGYTLIIFRAGNIWFCYFDDLIKIYRWLIILWDIF